MKQYTLAKIKNHFPDNALRDVRGALLSTLNSLKDVLENKSSIAIAVGSRGIDHLALVVKGVVDFVKDHGINPFIVPAMGSHGGATAEGQAEILAGYGITESEMGTEIKSSMEVVELPNEGMKNRIFMDKFAFESDGVILINKIKPHTDFHGKYESGLVKMAVIGLGKEHGAEAIHHFGVHGLTELIPASARKILATNKILGGIAFIENSKDKTMMIKAIKAKDIMEEEPKLLEVARKNRPAFPVDRFDVLIIDKMGKNISGVGIDTNIIGRLKIYGQPEPKTPAIKSIIITDITNESHGNATGVGLADIITRRLFNKIDFTTTYKNIATSSFLERAKIPFVVENDIDALQLALRNCGHSDPGQERVIRIQDTLHLEELYVSNAILDEVSAIPQIEILDQKVNLFDEHMNFTSF
jgi:hypothetical protein